MKLFLVALLAAAAVAQPAWLNPTYLSGVHPYTGLYGSSLLNPLQPVVYTNPMVKPVEYKVDEEKTMEKNPELKPVVYTSPFGQPVVPVEYKVEVPARYSVKNGEVEHHVYKREAEPIYPYITPYTTPYVSTPYVSSYTPYINSYTPYLHRTVVPAVAPAVAAVPKVTYKKPVIHSDAKTVANDVVSPYMYADKGRYVADSEGALHVAKRDAEADPALIYRTAVNPYVTPYASHYTTPYLSGYATTPYATTPYAYPSIYSSVLPYHLQVKSYKNDAVNPEIYASKNQYRAETAGSLHVAKREAEADPAFVYRSSYGLPYTTAYSTGYVNPYVSSVLPYTSSYYNAFRPYSGIYY